MRIMLAQLDVHNARSNLVDALVEKVALKAKVGVGVKKLINGLYIVCFQPLYPSTAPRTLKYEGWPLRRWPMGTIKDPCAYLLPFPNSNNLSVPTMQSTSALSTGYKESVNVTQSPTSAKIPSKTSARSS